MERAWGETSGKVHLIGHSLGGIIARSVAGGNSKNVASVITLGSPFRGTKLHPRIFELVNMVRRQILEKVLPDCYTASCTCSFLDHLKRDSPGVVVRNSHLYEKRRSGGLALLFDRGSGRRF
jgi:alpha-beta hydrolase superfamily lysophospholipase